MVLRHRIFSLLLAGVLSIGADAAFGQTTNTYDLSTVNGSTTSSPILVTGSDGSTTVSFSSPSSPGTYSVVANNGLYSNLGNYILNDLGSTTNAAGTIISSPLDLTFSSAQSSVTFDFALTDALQLSGLADTISVSTGTGTVLGTATAALVGSDLFPEGSITVSSATAFTSLVVTAPTTLTLTVADLSSTSPAPEPESVVLMLTGLLVVGVAARRRNRR